MRRKLNNQFTPVNQTSGHTAFYGFHLLAILSVKGQSQIDEDFLSTLFESMLIVGSVSFVALFLR